MFLLKCFQHRCEKQMQESICSASQCSLREMLKWSHMWLFFLMGICFAAKWTFMSWKRWMDMRLKALNQLTNGTRPTSSDSVSLCRAFTVLATSMAVFLVRFWGEQMKQTWEFTHNCVTYLNHENNRAQPVLNDNAKWFSYKTIMCSEIDYMCFGK